MEVMGFKSFLESALETTIQKTVSTLLNESTDVAAAKKAAGSRSVLENVKSSLSGLVTECIETSKLAINAPVFADFIKAKLEPHADDVKNALLDARYDSLNERAVLTGKHEGLQAILTGIPTLLEQYIAGPAPAPMEAPASVDASGFASACDSDACDTGGSA